MGARKAFLIALGATQGDSLSPYLFVMGMEVFSPLIKLETNGGFHSGHSINGSNGFVFSFSHSLFVKWHSSALQGLDR